MRTLEKYSQYVIIPEPISQAAISKARSEFQTAFARNPLEIRLSNKALGDMCKELKIDRIPSVFTNESVQGLLIEMDGDLKEGEWLVGYHDEIVRERP